MEKNSIKKESKESSYVIDFADFRNYFKRPTALFGEELGKQIRTDSGIDKLIEKHKRIIIKIPEDVLTINPSFLEEFLRNAVKRLGKTGFKETVTFENPGKYKVDTDVDNAIASIVWESED